MAGELSVADIARRHGVSRRTAYRWLVEIEKEFGSKVVGRRGKKGVLYTTEEAFAQVTPLVADRSASERRAREIETRVGDIERRADRSAEELAALQRDFQRASKAWFSRKS